MSYRCDNCNTITPPPFIPAKSDRRCGCEEPKYWYSDNIITECGDHFITERNDHIVLE